MKKAFRWVVMFVAVMLVMATCGIQKQIRDEYDVFTDASQALKEQNWRRFLSVLGERSLSNGPSEEAQIKFFEKYVAQRPEVILGEGTTWTLPSRLVPIPNHVTRHSLPPPTSLSIVSVQYLDIRSEWSIPFVSKRLSIFGGKRVSFNFFQTFVAVAKLRDAAPVRQRAWKSLARFAREEGKALTSMGIEPKNLRYEGSWDEFAKLMDERAERNRQRGLGGQSGPPPKDSRRGL